MVTAATNAYEVLAIRYGSRQAVKSEVYLNFHLYGEPDDAIGMDYFVWVARNAQRTVLVDTGFSASAGRRRGRPVGVAPVAALAGLGVDPASDYPGRRDARALRPHRQPERFPGGRGHHDPPRV